MSDPVKLISELGTGLQTDNSLNLGDFDQHIIESQRSVEDSRETSKESCISSIYNAHFNTIEHNDDTDEYVEDLHKILESIKQDEIDNVDIFMQLFRTRFALDPSIDADGSLKFILINKSLGPRDFMNLTQKHFNEFGGFKKDQK